MKNLWRTKALLWWQRVVLSRAPSYDKLKLSSGGTGAKSLLILLPEEHEDAQIMGHFIKSLIGRVAPHFVCHEKSINFYPKELQGNMIPYSDNDITRWGIIGDNGFRDKIAHLNIEALINLTLKDHLLYFELSNSIHVPIKIGFHTEMANDYYNIIIDRDQESFIEKSLDNIFNILGIA